MKALLPPVNPSFEISRHLHFGGLNFYMSECRFLFISTVFKFVELPDNNEKQSDQKSKVKFKIMSLKVNAGVDYVPELVSFLWML